MELTAEEKKMKEFLEHIEKNKDTYGIDVGGYAVESMGYKKKFYKDLGCTPEALYIYAHYKDQIKDCKNKDELDKCIKTEASKENKINSKKMRSIALKTLGKVLATVALTVVTPPIGLAVGVVMAATTYRDIRNYNKEVNKQYSKDVEEVRDYIRGQQMKKSLIKIARSKSRSIVEQMEKRETIKKNESKTYAINGRSETISNSIRKSTERVNDASRKIEPKVSQGISRSNSNHGKENQKIRKNSQSLEK